MNRRTYKNHGGVTFKTIIRKYTPKKGSKKIGNIPNTPNTPTRIIHRTSTNRIRPISYRIRSKSHSIRPISHRTIHRSIMHYPLRNSTSKNPTVDKIIKKARDIFGSTPDKTIPYDLIGYCGLSQSSIYHAARMYNISDDNIIRLNVATFVEGATHAFDIIHIQETDTYYICDLSFSQFVFSEDELRTLALKQLRFNSYTKLNSASLELFFRQSARFGKRFTLNNRTPIPRRLVYKEPYTPYNIIEEITNFEKLRMDGKEDELDHTAEELNVAKHSIRNNMFPNL